MVLITYMLIATALVSNVRPSNLSLKTDNVPSFSEFNQTRLEEP